jgi:subtilisin-like proprotein convertase family protein
MKTKNIALSILFFGVSAINLYSQEYTLNGLTNNTTINTCSGTLYDSGGADGNYQNNEIYSITICSDIPGNRILLNFISFNTESNSDWMTIYDGPSSASPAIITQASATLLQGHTIQSSGECVTILWNSDLAIQGAGFQIAIHCAMPCQDYSIDITNSVPPLTLPESLWIDACQGTNISFTANGNFPNNNTDYLQSDENLFWTWLIYHNGISVDTISGQSLNQIDYTFNESGWNSVAIIATDENFCFSSTPNALKVQVSHTPNFSNIFVDPGICLGETIELSNQIQVDTSILPLTLKTFEPFCINDDYYQLWQDRCMFFSPVNTGQIINSATDIESICINMEHSYIGDLAIKLTCPNGSFVNLLTYPNLCDNGYLGIPNDEIYDCIPGVGFYYCWTMDALNSINVACTEGTTLPAGNYLPADSFENLIGCPVAGNWCVSFMDNLSADDGTVFSIEINLSEELYQLDDLELSFANTYDLSPESVDVFWTGTGVEQNSGVTSVTPEIVGDYSYTLSATDDFGCAYDTTFNVVVYDPTDLYCSEFCSSEVYNNLTDTINDGSGDFPSQNNSNCEWLISLNQKSDNCIFIYWNYFNTRENDIFKIYDGNNSLAPLLVEFSGSSVPDYLVSTGNEVYITYITDATERSQGWELVYQSVLVGTSNQSFSKIVVYPNPSSENISIYGLSEKANTVKVFDIYGVNHIAIENFDNGTIDISKLSAGIYFIRIEDSGKIETIKFVKE